MLSRKQTMKAAHQLKEYAVRMNDALEVMNQQSIELVQEVQSDKNFRARAS